MKKPWINVAVFDDEHSAGVLETFFRNKAMEARTYHDGVLYLFLFLRRPQMTWRVQVPGNFHHFAQELLEKNSPDIVESAIHCPSCGSLEVNYPQLRRDFVLPTVLLHLGIIFRFMDHQCYCEKCHWMWSLPRRTAAAGVHTVKPAHLPP